MQSPFANLTPVVKNLIIINILFFVATYALQQFVELEKLLGAFYPASPLFKPWQPITYMFMHGGFTHIFFNMFAVFMFGPILEQTMGSKRFFNYYFITGLGAFALYMVVQAIQLHGITGTFTIPHPEVESSYFNYGGGQEQAIKLYSIYNFPMVGASGAVFGILVGFGLLFPELEMMIIFLPVPIKAKYYVIGYVILELFSGVRQAPGDNVAHFAHLGGALIGFILIKIWGMKKTNNYY
ncbi:rhomboid family intramembrane serine protease [Mucilaginibacter psychrotolerans]|uniref:Rhomboid family intramembrane serine protease n=1 Tax=Mucilaginibacter psychrotolerans TaxID=1524096 RepID=A0A4Y8SHT6_9SPHI|nr:rhomboid family intramembrane serine protease [Mucilaginibacter psychrotolerans]TFF38442.1 rhomboid family intramembrane serine protease [Mucilaginibacter psychrotolerans]